jgi:hypothetical protein
VIEGRWAADVQYDWGATQREVFSFEPDDEGLRGTASFLGVDRPIADGKVDRDELSFVTRTSETQGGEMRMAAHQYVGTITGDTIQFTMQTTGGFSEHPPIVFSAERAR